MCLFVVSFQASNGSGFFIYVAEVCVDAANGLCLTMLMACLIVITYASPQLISMKGYGVEGMILTLACLQCVYGSKAT